MAAAESFNFMKRAVGILISIVAVSAMPGTGAAEPSLQKRPFTVIAVVDSGIDPYHLDFRRPEMTAHPSTYIEGFPSNAPAFRLTFDAFDAGAAYGKDHERWTRLQRNRLYWIPGTNIIGAIGPFDVNDVYGLEGQDATDPDEPAFYDRVGHGTQVASLAAGSIHGPDAPDTLIVAVKGFEDALEWAVAQPWIDVVTNAWWNPPEAANYRRAADASRAAVEDGKVVCFASGNFSHPQLYVSTQGPSWNVNVGAASATTRGEHYYTNYPNDVLGLSGVPAAMRGGAFDGEIENFSGTSAAAPSVCGLIAKTISEVRARAGDHVAGPKNGALVVGPRARGHMKDGRLTRAEVEDAIQATAVPASSDPDPSDGSVPAVPGAEFMRGGYGIVDVKSQKQALAVILGLKDRPARAQEDAWLAATDALRDAVWGEGP